MNCQPSQNMNVDQASGQGQVVVALLASDTTLLSTTTGTTAVDEIVIEAEMHRRAGVITDVLARIMEEPTPRRHWGLNE